jgi:protein-tyrosine phosphatase
MDGVSNTRDIGGKTTEDGKKVKQGLIYRGAYLDEVTAEGITQALEKYGIKTDLDLRKGAEGTAGTSSPLGSAVQYLQYSCPYYLGTAGIDNKANWENLANAIKVFANKDNYPVYFHCSVGRDRTAMVAMLLEGILGVTKEDMLIDYEMSFFSYRGCLDGANPRDMVTMFINTRRYVEKYDSNDELSFAEQCEKYLLDIGVTQAEINAIREIMLEVE